jgi:hypothetical protein
MAMSAMADARTNVLSSLLAVRAADEGRAERALAAAIAARAHAEAEETRLIDEVERARRELGERRREVDAPGARAAEAVARRHFWARLVAALDAKAAVVEAFRRDDLPPARRAEVDARAAHLRARQRREVVERALARREATRVRLLEQRAEADADDRRHGGDR